MFRNQIVPSLYPVQVKLFECMQYLCISLALTRVLMPLEKGKSWSSAGTMSKKSRAEQNTEEPAAENNSPD